MASPASGCGATAPHRRCGETATARAAARRIPNYNPTEYSVPVVAVAVAGHRLLTFSRRMTGLFLALLASFRAATRSRVELWAEILALRHQPGVASWCRALNQGVGWGDEGLDRGGEEGMLSSTDG